jgi:hypothetical protein
MAAWRERLVDSFLFDLTENDFWHPLWGEPPGDCENARAIVARHLADAPPLIPIYAHRAIPNEPLAAGNPVFSVWQAVDTIVYGVDLGDYLRREFHRGAELAESCRPIRFWTSVVDPSSPAV